MESMLENKAETGYIPRRQFLRDLAIGFGALAGLGSIDGLVSKVWAGDGKKEEKLWGDKTPDKDIYKIINELNPEYAEKLNNEKKYDEVIRYLKPKLDIVDDYDLNLLKKEQKEKIAYAFNEIGISYKFKKNYNIALNSYKISLYLNPNEVKVHLNIGKLYIDGFNNYKLALKYFESALKIDPDNFIAKTYKRKCEAKLH